MLYMCCSRAAVYLVEQDVGHGGAAHGCSWVTRSGFLDDVRGEHPDGVDGLIVSKKVIRWGGVPMNRYIRLWYYHRGSREFDGAVTVNIFFVFCATPMEHDIKVQLHFDQN